ncbi:MAG: hypothetical protein H6747_15215 [Deltaproteobacteria bacterium]|nr:hypothetical protein [Deltaproteobacteria bacterium]
MSRSHRLDIAATWDRRPLSADAHSHLVLRWEATTLLLQIEAPFAGDPAPTQPAGSTPRLWEHEVVELMLLGADARYLELEFGPHGHYLALRLDGVRTIVEEGMALDFHAEIEGDRWRGEARVPRAWLPDDLRAANAFRIAGTGADRSYQAAFPAGGDAPDFHRLEAFAPLSTLAPEVCGVDWRGLLDAIDRAIDDANGPSTAPPTDLPAGLAAWLDQARQRLDFDRLPRGESYARCLVGHSPRHGASLFVMGWTPGVPTPIHDHGSWGIVGVVRGTLQEERFDADADGTFVGAARRPLRAGEVAAFASKPTAIHRVVAADHENPVSIHVYGDAAASFHIYDPDTFTAELYIPETLDAEHCGS